MRLGEIRRKRTGWLLRAHLLLLLGLVTGWRGAVGMAQETNQIEPGAVWLDTAGKPIQAHGGGVLKSGAFWYWFGEDRTQGRDPLMRYVSCYRSRDLVHWEDRGIAFESAQPQDLREKWGESFVLERPKVYKVADGSYVMYVHLDSGPKGKPYFAAEVGVAVSPKIEGPYRFVTHFRPLGQESRDIGQFVDDDGTNYLIFESRPTHGFYIAKLSGDGLSVTETSFIKAPLEGGAIVHYNGLYYVLGSHMTGWAPNPNVYATAKDIAGPWSSFTDIAPPETNTYTSQSSMLIKVVGSKTTTIIYTGDRWEPKTLWDSRYVWMPLQFPEGTMVLPEPHPWTIDVKSGIVR